MTTSKTVQDWISELKLIPHPEGGYFRETHRSREIIPSNGLPERYSGDRSISTAILYLLPGGTFSPFHRIKSEECWHFYAGSPLLLYWIDSQGDCQKIRLTGNGAVPSFQAVIPAGYWFAAEVESGGEYALTGCTVSPGFDFRDFEFADRDELIRIYPRHRSLIERLTR